MSQEDNLKVLLHEAYKADYENFKQKVRAALQHALKISLQPPSDPKHIRILRNFLFDLGNELLAAYRNQSQLEVDVAFNNAKGVEIPNDPNL